jgi:hypothetical protein
MGRGVLHKKGARAVFHAFSVRTSDPLSFEEHSLSKINSSCPALSRASIVFLMDGRVEPGHDEKC